MVLRSTNSHKHVSCYESAVCDTATQEIGIQRRVCSPDRIQGVGPRTKASMLCCPFLLDFREGFSPTTSCGDTPVIASDSSSITLDVVLDVRAVIVCTSGYAINEDDINSLEVVANVSVNAMDFSGNAVDAVGTTVVSLDQVRRTRMFLPLRLKRTKCGQSPQNKPKATVTLFRERTVRTF